VSSWRRHGPDRSCGVVVMDVVVIVARWFWTWRRRVRHFRAHGRGDIRGVLVAVVASWTWSRDLARGRGVVKALWS
jgi:hypothetical protein